MKEFTEETNNNCGDVMDKVKDMKVHRSPKGETIFEFKNIGHYVGQRQTRKGNNIADYLLFEGRFIKFNGTIMSGCSEDILELPVKSCLQQLAGLIQQNPEISTKPSKVRISVSKHYRKYELKLIA